MSGPESAAPPQEAVKPPTEVAADVDEVARQAAEAARKQIETDAFVTAPAKTMEAVSAAYKDTDAPWKTPYEQANNAYLSGYGVSSNTREGNMETYKRTGFNEVEMTRSDVSQLRNIKVKPEGEVEQLQHVTGAELRASTSVRNETGPAEGLGILHKRPKSGETTLQYEGRIVSPQAGKKSAEEIAQTPDGQIVTGSDSTVTEVKRGAKRIVEREVVTGIDNEGKTKITVKQRSTDLQGQNPRERTWEHTPGQPNQEATLTAENPGQGPDLTTGKKINQGRVARKTAASVAKRVVDSQV